MTFRRCARPGSHPRARFRNINITSSQQYGKYLLKVYGSAKISRLLRDYRLEGNIDQYTTISEFLGLGFLDSGIKNPVKTRQSKAYSETIKARKEALKSLDTVLNTSDVAVPCSDGQSTKLDEILTKRTFDVSPKVNDAVPKSD